MITFQEESLWAILHEIQELIKDHYEEISERKDIIGPLDPNYPVYKILSDSGVLHILTARDNGKLIGYYFAFIHPMLHYKNMIHSQDDIHFLSKEYRQSRVGLRLFLEAEKMIKKYKAVISFVRVKVAHDHGNLLEHLGYKFTEKLYSKVLI